MLVSLTCVFELAQFALDVHSLSMSMISVVKERSGSHAQKMLLFFIVAHCCRFALSSIPTCDERAANVTGNLGFCFDGVGGRSVVQFGNVEAQSQLSWPSSTTVFSANGSLVGVVAWVNERTGTIQVRTTLSATIFDISSISSRLVDQHINIQTRRFRLVSLGEHVNLSNHFVVVFDNATSLSSACIYAVIMVVDSGGTVRERQTLIPAIYASPFMVDPDIVVLPINSPFDGVFVLTYRGKVSGDDAGVDLVRVRFVNETFVVDTTRPYRHEQTDAGINVFYPSMREFGDRYRLGNVSLLPRLALFAPEPQRQSRHVCLVWAECGDALGYNCSIFYRTFTATLENAPTLKFVSLELWQVDAQAAADARLTSLEGAAFPAEGFLFFLAVQRTLGATLVTGRKPDGDGWGGGTVSDLSMSCHDISVAEIDMASMQSWSCSSSSNSTVFFRLYSPFVELPRRYNFVAPLVVGGSMSHVAAVRYASKAVGFLITFVVDGAIVVREVLPNVFPLPQAIFHQLDVAIVSSTTIDTGSVVTSTKPATTPLTLSTTTLESTSAKTSSILASTPQTTAITAVVYVLSTMEVESSWVVPVVVTLSAIIAFLFAALLWIAMRRPRVTSAVEPYWPRNAEKGQALSRLDRKRDGVDGDDDASPISEEHTSTTSPKPVPAPARL